MRMITKKALIASLKALLCLFFLGVIIHFPAHAAGQKLISITSDEYPNQKSTLVLDTDDRGDIEGIHLNHYNSQGALIGQTPTMNIKEITRGLPLMQKDKRNIVVLVSENFAFQNGGSITVDYLKNGIKGERNKDFKVELTREGDDWKLGLPADGRPISGLHFVSNRAFMVGTIGIEKIEISREDNSTKFAADGRDYWMDDVMPI